MPHPEQQWEVPSNLTILFPIPMNVLVVCRPNEARVMYEKLQSHPNAQVSKKARQYMFSFQVNY